MEGCPLENKTSAWQNVQTARHPKRPTSIHLIQSIFPDFLELHGDRLYRDDPAIIAGLATLNQTPITIIAQEKGTTTQEKIARNFGMVHPEGYHKMLRLCEQAEKFHRPILFLIDTPGAYPGIGAEERGQANAIARSLFQTAQLQVPTISVILSEGGSGGALAMGLSDLTIMFENAIYSILSPEGFASILYKDASLAPKAAETMKLTAFDLKQYGVCDVIIPEQKGGLHEEYRASYQYLKEQLVIQFTKLSKYSSQERIQKRNQKFRRIGDFQMTELERDDEFEGLPSRD